MKQLSVLFFIITSTLFYNHVNGQSPSDFVIKGGNTAWEGQTCQYSIVYTGNSTFPAGYTLDFININNGLEIARQNNIYSGETVFVQIKWNCLVTNGSVTFVVHDPLGNVIYTYVHRVSLFSYSNYPDFGKEIDPNDQLVYYNQLPEILSISNCSPYCESAYGFLYQWEFATIQEGEAYNDIPENLWQKITINGNSANYQPPVMTAYGIKAYRRETKFLDPLQGTTAPEIIIKSKPSFVRFVTRLDPGSISTTTPSFNSYHNVPVINSTPALGGLCEPFNYIYTWQATDQDGNWQDIGNSETFPSAVAEIAYTISYRRKIQCGNETKFSNILTIYFNYVSENIENRNYIRQVEVHKPGAFTWDQVDGELVIGEKFQSTTYLDDFGRPTQKVSKETGTPPEMEEVWRDNVQFFKYDEYGRQPNSYLPYSSLTNPGNFKPDLLDEQRQYYEQYFSSDANYLFSLITFENSPLSRVTNTKSPGKAWQLGNGISVDINLPFNLSDKVPIIHVGPNEADLPVMNSYYHDGSLFEKITKDEAGMRTISYTNMSGQEIFKKIELAKDADENVINKDWICTYYVYDDIGNLRYTIEPEAVIYFSEHEWIFNTVESQSVLNGLCFKYYYDAFGNVIVKKTPGNAELQMAYDRRNRLILRQDGNQRNAISPTSTLNLYDENDRPIITAIFTLNPGKTIKDYRIDIELTKPGDVLNNIFPHVFNPSISTILKYQYYDDYAFPLRAAFDNGFGNDQAYPLNLPGNQPIRESKRVRGFTTGSKTLVLNGINSFYLSGTIYYDENGRPLQSITDNVTRAQDIVTNQYYWDGRVLSSEILHSALSTPYSRFSIITKNNYDKIGRLQLIEKKIAANPFKKITSYVYDDMGRVKVMHLSPDFVDRYQQPDIEVLNFSYNLQGWLTGINKDYALKTAGLYSKEGNQYGKTFGLYFRYEKMPDEDNLFGSELLTGQVAGQLWNTLGDDEQRKYEYTYDNVGRLTSASFWQRKDESQTWNNSTIDFSVGGNSFQNKIGYSLNGNILNMWQKGITIGKNIPLYVDNLSYKYETLKNANIPGNKLVEVKDFGDLSSINNYEKLGDFKNGQIDFGEDYVYDDNGNIVIDLNKGLKEITNAAIVIGSETNNQYISGIKYNYLNKPEEIHIEGKGTIKIIYDADGNKLYRKFESEVTGNTTATLYAGSFVYNDTYSNNPSGSNGLPPGNLSYILFEDGRVRVVQNTDIYKTDPINNSIVLDRLTIHGNEELITGAVHATYDYFIKDNLQNVRMVLTEEEHEGTNTCTMEDARQPDEVQSGIFQYPASALIYKNQIPPSNGGNSPWTMAGRGKVAKLSKNGVRMGPNTLQKVMAGDRVNATCEYFYNQNPSNVNEPGLISQLIPGLLLNMVNISPGIATTVKDQLLASNTLASDLPLAINSIASPNEIEQGTLAPKAYLTILFFDERFNFVSENSSSTRVTTMGDHDIPLSLIDIPAPKNGYVYIYVSNESNTPVYFDNMVVNFKRNILIEENHYYPFGLKIAAISSVKGADINEGKIKNDYKYQGAYNEFDEDLGLNDFALRSYDPQIGRWFQSDPYDQYSSGYVAMSNNPISYTDPNGGFDGWAGSLIGGVVGATAALLIANNNNVQGAGLVSAVFGGAFLGSGLGFGTSMASGLEGGHDLGGFHLGGYFRAFYAGLFGKEGFVTGHFNGTLDNDGTYIDIPSIWGGKSGGSSESEGMSLPRGIDLDDVGGLSLIKILSIVEKQKSSSCSSMPDITFKAPSVTISNPCLCSSSRTVNLNRSFSANDGTDGGQSFEDPTLSDEQVNAMSNLIRQARGIMRPGDVVTGSLTQTMAFPNYQPNLVPIAGGMAVASYNSATNRRIDGNVNLVRNSFNQSLSAYQGRTVLANLRSQTAIMANAMSSSLQGQIMPLTRYQNAANRYRLAINITRTITTLVPCPCNSGH